MKLLQNSKIYHTVTELTWYTYVKSNLLPKRSVYYSVKNMWVRLSVHEYKLIYWKVTPVPNHTGVHNETV